MVGLTGNKQSAGQPLDRLISVRGTGRPCEEGTRCCTILVRCHAGAHVGRADWSAASSKGGFLLPLLCSEDGAASPLRGSAAIALPWVSA